MEKNFDDNFNEETSLEKETKNQSEAFWKKRLGEKC